MECLPPSGLCSEGCTCFYVAIIIILPVQKRKLSQGKVKALKPHNESGGQPAFELRQSDCRPSMLLAFPPLIRLLLLPSGFHWLTPPTHPTHPPLLSKLCSTFLAPLKDAMLHFLSRLSWRLGRSYRIFSKLRYTTPPLFISPPFIYQLVGVLQFCHLFPESASEKRTTPPNSSRSPKKHVIDTNIQLLLPCQVSQLPFIYPTSIYHTPAVHFST